MRHFIGNLTISKSILRHVKYDKSIRIDSNWWNINSTPEKECNVSLLGGLMALTELLSPKLKISNGAKSCLIVVSFHVSSNVFQWLASVHQFIRVSRRAS